MDDQNKPSTNETTDIVTDQPAVPSGQPVPGQIPLSDSAHVIPEMGLPAATPLRQNLPENHPALSFNIQPTTLKSAKRKWLIPLIVVVNLVISVLLVYGIFVLPRQNTQNFTVKSKTIASDLTNDITDLHDNNFKSLATVIVDFDKSKMLMEKHVTDFHITQDKITKLKADYQKLKPTKKNAANKKKIDGMFKLGQSIEDKYQNSLNFRITVYDAYGILPHQLNEYLATYQKGGLRTTLISQTEAVVVSATAGLTKLKAFTPEPDDKVIKDIRIGFLADVQKTFTTIGLDYKTAKDSNINDELVAFSNRNVALNKQIDASLAAYVSSSSIAKDFTDFNTLAK